MAHKVGLRPVVVRFSCWNRRRKAALVRSFMATLGCRTVLMVGALPPQSTYDNEGVVERAVEEGHEVVMGINVVRPRGRFGYPFMVADACDMPFRDGFVDFALANAVIEHVGEEADQRRFVAEHTRVARAWAITTPNRWFPVEAHTSTVVRHWSSAWRGRQRSFTRLLSKRELRDLLPDGARIVGHWWSPTLTALYAEPAEPVEPAEPAEPSRDRGRGRRGAPASGRGAKSGVKSGQSRA